MKPETDKSFLENFFCELYSFGTICKDIEELYSKKLIILKANHERKLENEKGKECSAITPYILKRKAKEKAYNNEIVNVFSEIPLTDSEENNVQNNNNREQRLQQIWTDYCRSIDILNSEVEKAIQKDLQIYSDFLVTENSSFEKEKSLIETEKTKALKQEEQKFIQKFPPEELKNLIFDIYSDEPNPNDYCCRTVIPQYIKLGNLTVSTSSLSDGSDNGSTIAFNQYSIDMLERYYCWLESRINGMTREICIKIPFGIDFGEGFNYLFYLSKDNEDLVTDRIRSVIMKLFLAMPPSKINFMFFDPVKLGATFSVFQRLVDYDDRSNKVIGKQIWTTSEDIENNLLVITNHISNINQRCLKGKYKSIQEYNLAAEENAEAYRVITVMDFPSGFNKKSLSLFEKIISTGSACGVYAIVIVSEEQLNTIDSKLKPLVEKIMNNLTSFSIYRDRFFATRDNRINIDKKSAYTFIDIPKMWEEENLGKVIPILKQGIKNAGNIVINIEKLDRLTDEIDCTKNIPDGMKIPIGIRGANEVQYLTLHPISGNHVIVIGSSGMGKSSLMHTIIYQTIKNYTPEDVQIFLVDMKKGVEFTIYAKHKLPWFKVVSVESEREFAFSILQYIDQELEKRSYLFKSIHTSKIDKIEQYNADNKKIPQIIVILEEFKELFMKQDKITEESLQIISRIINQGRAYGVHLILSSQICTDVLNPEILGQITTRILFKCDKRDADKLIDNGGNEIALFSNDESGRAIYNSERGIKSFNVDFRVAYIPPDEHDELIENISKKYLHYDYPETKILISYVENNLFSVFNQFQNRSSSTDNQIYIGENLDINEDMKISFKSEMNSNLLLLGSDTAKAYSMFFYAVLSLCINYYMQHKHLPDTPFIHIVNYLQKPSKRMGDYLKIMGNELPDYVEYISVFDENKPVKQLFDRMKNDDTEQHFVFIYGYQNMIQYSDYLELQQSLEEIYKKRAVKGIHTILYNDCCNEIISSLVASFNMRIGFGLTSEEYRDYLFHNDNYISKENAVLYIRNDNEYTFRPYHLPSDIWMRKIFKQLNDKKREENENE